MSWPLVKLGAVCKLVNGDRGTNYPSKDSILSHGIPFINAGNLTDEHSIVCSGANYISEERYDLLSNGKIQRGDILFCLRGSLGKFAVVDSSVPKGAIASSLVIIRPEKSICENFLKNYLRSTLCAREISRFENGAAQPNLSAKDLREFEIPLPPLPEQKRIAAILDKADAIRRKRQQAIQLADDFLRAVFLDMFGDVIEGAENVVRFSDIAVLDAPMVDPRVDEYIDLIHIGPDRIEKKIGKLLPALTAREEGLISKKFLFDNRYVLYSKIRPYLRKCAIAEGVGLCSADMYPVRPVEGVATKEFLWMLLLSDFFTAYTESLPARANIPKLNREELEAFTLSLPDYSQQLKFSSIVKTTKIASQRVVESAAYVDGAFESLSQKAFSGQL